MKKATIPEEKRSQSHGKFISVVQVAGIATAIVLLALPLLAVEFTGRLSQ